MGSKTGRPEKILVVDDERSIRTYLRLALGGEGYEVIEAESGSEAIELVRNCRPDALLLDHGLGDISGVEVTRNLRGWTWVPIIFISVREDEATKIEALDSGADDYLSKPFSRDELLARLRANLRRKNVVPVRGVLYCGDLKLDQDERQASRKGESIPLTPNEVQILGVLMRNLGKLVTHRQILTEVWGPPYADEVHMLRVNIFNLRKKIEKSGPRCLLNEPGLGYRLVPGPA